MRVTQAAAAHTREAVPRMAQATGRWLLDQLYPPRCAACGAFGCYLCQACEARLLAANERHPRCPNCAARWDGELNCPRCLLWDALGGAVAPFELEGAARRLVHGLKYRGASALGQPMAAAIKTHTALPATDVAYAVPIHRRRERARGFNQSTVLLEHLGLPAGPGELRRLRSTRSQIGLSGKDRLANVAGAMDYRGPNLAGLRIALVDDVITTGATANECARVLRDHGAREVTVIAFARASYDLVRGPQAGPA